MADNSETTCTLECPNCGHQGAHDHVWAPQTEWAAPFLAQCGGCEGLYVVISDPSPLSLARAIYDGHTHRTAGFQPWREGFAATTDELMARVIKGEASRWNEYIAHLPEYASFAPATERQQS